VKPSASNRSECFALLDDCDSTSQAPSSRLYSQFARAVQCFDPAKLDAAWDEVESEVQSGRHAVVLADYEWGVALQLGGAVAGADDANPCLQVLLFEQIEHLSRQQVDRWLADFEGCDLPRPAGIINAAWNLDQADYEQQIRGIRELIASGETYQVNYTYRIAAQQFGCPVSFYRRLRKRQPVRYGALIALPDSRPDREWIVSCSPELFVEQRRGQIVARPMKGTVARGTSESEDIERARWLGQDPKNRAENVMIVDLLRNDIGRISQTGSVHVPELFKVETYATVHQMTSTVAGSLRRDVAFPEVLRALFPCGSITGAPKVHTMRLIAGLESTPRGIYTGAIGWYDGGEALCGDFCLSVAIRTVCLGVEATGTRSLSCGVGGGIVWDSEPGSEYEETRVKARFLTGADPGFTLIETVLIRWGTPQHLERHLHRLGMSARALGFRFDDAEVARQVKGRAAEFGPEAMSRLRVDLRHDGAVEVRAAPLFRIGKQVDAVLAPSRLTSIETALVRHKTSLRETYDAALGVAQAYGAFDAIFFNDRDELTEGARSNVFVKLDGQWWTPPPECGLLPGIQRGRVLEAARRGVRERVIKRKDLRIHEGIVLANSLRGLLHCTLRETSEL
jgi:para-aminobenzoate synthetase/4-amino-4-deoxychorismate lyase